DMDVDRIVKETKRTTIVENKEVIYFKRPNRRSQSTPRCTEVSGKDDSERTILSIRESVGGVREGRRYHSSSLPPSNDSMNEKEKEGTGEKLAERVSSDTSSRSPSHRVSFHPSSFQPDHF
ncbi:hypothetical protein PMAYCL1PPCAC_29342, partial [Pristionchus mayeri]